MIKNRDKWLCWIRVGLVLSAAALQCCWGKKTEQWEVMQSGVDKHLYEVWGTSINDVFAVGEEGTILHFDGLKWAAMDSGTALDLKDVWGLGSNAVFAVGGKEEEDEKNTTSIVLHYDGKTWKEAFSIQGKGVLSSIWGSSEDDLYTVGESSPVYHFDGKTWSALSGKDQPNNGSAVWGSSRTNVFVSSREGAWRFNGDGWLLHQLEHSRYCSGIWGSSSTSIFMLCHGETRTDFYCPYLQWFNGNSWKISDNRIEPDTSGKVCFVYPTGMTSFSDEEYWAVGRLIGDHATGENSKYCAGLDSAAVFLSDGEKWLYQSLSDVTDNPLNAIWGPSPNDIFAVGQSGTIIRYGL